MYLERGDGLLEVVLLAVDVGNQQRLAVAAERVLEQVRQLALPVGRVRAPFGGEGDDDLLEVGERLVNVHRLRAQVAERISLLEALGAGEVDEVELALGHHARRVHARADLDVHREDCVAARRGAVELMVCDLPIGLPLEEEREGLLLGGDRLDAQVLHRRRPMLVLHQRQRIRHRLRRRQRREQVDERVLVDFNIRDRNGGLKLRMLGNVGEDVADGARRDPAVLVRL